MEESFIENHKYQGVVKLVCSVNTYTLVNIANYMKNGLHQIA